MCNNNIATKKPKKKEKRAVKKSEPLNTKAQEQKKLYRSKNDKMLGGVCGGIAEYVNTDPTLIRLLVVLFTLLGGSGILFYIAVWLVILKEA